jgi:DNA helicase-2/ATP-dependent DNA helicase PcrA
MSPPDLLQQLLLSIDYEEHLKKTQSDWETRWENVQELINFASEVRTDDLQDGDGTEDP